jgi:hypothetical protein
MNVCSPRRFFLNEKITLEDELEFTKQIFLTGTWRLNEYYERERMRISVIETAGYYA